MSGEPITWDAKGDFGAASYEELVEYASVIGAAALLVRHWPTSSRHEARWALMGALLRSDWPEERALGFVRAVVAVAQPGEPEALNKIDGDIDRYKGLRENGDNTVGLPHLMELCGSEAVKEAGKLLGLRKHKTSKRGGYIVNANGDPVASLANAVAMLRASPVWQGVLAYNEFSLFPVARKELPPPWKKPAGSNWSDVDDLRIAEWLQQNGIHVSPRTAAEAVQTVADENRFHPVKEYLESLKWDGTERIGSWLSTYLGVEKTVFSTAVGARWLISAVARIYQPGCRADHTLLIEGPQGIQKSTALRALAVRDEWFNDDIGDLENKDALLTLHGVWVVEFGELANIKRSQVQRVKSFLTSRFDHFRPPYGHRHVHVPRTNVFSGSVNEHSYLADETGNRRFWPVLCGDLDVAGIERDCGQLWAEAKHRYDEKARWWLDTDELNHLAAAEQDGRYEPGVWDDLIVPWLEDPKHRRLNDPVAEESHLASGVFQSDRDFVTITDVLIHCIGKDVNKFTQSDRNTVGRCLRHLKWKEDRQKGVKKIRGFARPPGPHREPGDE